MKVPIRVMVRVLVPVGLAVLAACGEPKDAAHQPSAGSTAANPPAEGFNAAGSDAKAMELADRTMDAMGGRAAWDSVRLARSWLPVEISSEAKRTCPAAWLSRATISDRRSAIVLVSSFRRRKAPS